MRRVVITGLGIISPIGIGKKDFGTSLFQGKSGIVPKSRFAKDGLRFTAGGDLGEVPFSDYLDPGKTRRFCRASKLALMASLLALEDAGLRECEWVDPTTVGVVLGSSWGCLETTIEFYDGVFRRGPARANPMLFSETVPNAPAGQISIACGIQGPNITIAQRENSAANAICTAADLIKKNRASTMIVGGLDVLTPELFEVHTKLRQVGGRPDGLDKSMPFDLRRTWPILAEGSCMLVFEEFEQARSRGAGIYGEIIGFSMTSSSRSSINSWTNDPEGTTRAIKRAIDAASLSPEQIDYICACANSSPVLDSMETAAIKQALGPHAANIPVSAQKSMYGDSGAADALGLAGMVLGMDRGLIPPTINYEIPDPACDLDCVPNQAREHRIRIGLLNSFAAGGANSSIVIKGQI